MPLETGTTKYENRCSSTRDKNSSIFVGMMTTKTIGRTTTLDHGKVLDLVSARHRLEGAGVRVAMPITEVPTGARLANIEKPVDVLIELVRSA